MQNQRKHSLGFILEDANESAALSTSQPTFETIQPHSIVQEKVLKRPLSSSSDEICWNFKKQKTEEPEEPQWVFDRSPMSPPKVSPPSSPIEALVIPNKSPSPVLESSFAPNPKWQEILDRVASAPKDFIPFKSNNQPSVLGNPNVPKFFTNGLFHPTPAARVSANPVPQPTTASNWMSQLVAGPHKCQPPTSSSQEEIVSWWLMSLRAQTYCYILNDAHTDNDKRFKCVFSSNCEKRIKGKGNLRRHIEWHLRRIEEEWKSNTTNSMASTLANVSFTVPFQPIHLIH